MNMWPVVMLILIGVTFITWMVWLYQTHIEPDRNDIYFFGMTSEERILAELAEIEQHRPHHIIDYRKEQTND